MRSIDWLRGIAVIFMIECHTLYLLNPVHDRDPLRLILNTINGLPAPSFILCAGLSLGLVCSRIETTWSALILRYQRTLKRIGIVLVSSLLIKHVHWDVFHIPERFFWPNVLDCIAISLFIIATITLFLPYRRMVLMAIAVLLFAIAPLVQKPLTFGFFTPLINNSVYIDTWPLVPWCGYGCIGAIIGLSAKRSDGSSRLSLLFLILGITGLAVAVGWPFLDLLYLPKHSAFFITNAGERCAYIGLLGLLLCQLERITPSCPTLQSNPITAVLELYSRQSLVAYIGHLLIFYGFWIIRPYNRFHQQTDWPTYLILCLSLMGATAILCYLFDQAPKLLGKIALLQPKPVAPRYDSTP